MSDPFVRRVGEVADVDGRLILVGVQHATVTLTVGGMQAQVDLHTINKLIGLLDSAWTVAINQGEATNA